MAENIIGRRRQLTCLAWLVGLILFFILIAWVVFRFSLPKPGSIRVGAVQDFQAGQAPRLLWKDSTPFYLVNTGEELIALAAQSVRREQSCIILWKPETSLFVDPCWGTRMDINGKYQGGGPPWEMTRLAVRVVNEAVWVEVRSPDADWYLATVSPGR